MEGKNQKFMKGSGAHNTHVHTAIETYIKNLLCTSAGAVTVVLLKLDENMKEEKIKKILQEYTHPRN